MNYDRLLLGAVLVVGVLAAATAVTGVAAGTTGADAHRAVGSGLALQTDNSTQNGTDGTQNDTNSSTDGQIDFGAGIDGGSNVTNGSTGDSGLLDGLEPIAQDAVRGAIVSLMNGFAEDTSNVTKEFQEEGIVFGFPAPGDPGSPTTWIEIPDDPSTVEDDRWMTTQKYHWVFGFLGFAGLLPALMLALGRGNRSPDRETAQRFVRGFVMILVGWIVIALCYHLADAITQIVAPEYEQYRSVIAAAEFGGVDQIVFEAVLGSAKGAFLTGALGVLYLQYILAFACAALWPVMWVLNTYRSTMARSAGKIGMAFMGALVVIKVLQAMIFRFLVQFEFGSPVANEVAATTGISIAFLLLPYLVLTKMIPRTLLIFGLHEIRREGHDERRYQERMGNIRRKFNQSLRRSPGGGVEQVGPAHRGSKGLPDRRPGQLEAARSDGGRGLPRGESADDDGSAGGDAEDRR